METDAYRDPFESVVGESQVMWEVLSNPHRLALTDKPILLVGESGTGKKLLTRVKSWNRS